LIHAERVLRHDSLDHVIILGRRHLLHVLRTYALGYFNEARSHQGLGQRIPVAGNRVPLARPGQVVAIPRARRAAS